MLFPYDYQVIHIIELARRFSNTVLKVYIENGVCLKK